MWRCLKRLPERGRIGIFNRSYYEEVLVVRVHPEILDSQQLPDPVDIDTIWDERLRSIRQQEEHLARNGTVVLNGTASDVWLLCDGEQNVGQIVDLMATAYGVASDEIRPDIETTVTQFVEEGFLPTP